MREPSRTRPLDRDLRRRAGYQTLEQAAVVLLDGFDLLAERSYLLQQGFPQSSNTS
ncbi:MAG TPA: hypothetical protein VET24_06605 [Actinomycetota bacterium]|nr:hypothetical protein [Actinomycetota bacterium]